MFRLTGAMRRSSSGEGVARVPVDVDWYTESFDEATQVLLTAQDFSSADVLKARPSHAGPAGEVLQQRGLPYVRTLIDNDPPEHFRFRQLVTPYFSKSRIDALRQTVRDVTHELVENARSRGAMEVVSEIAAPLPMRVIGMVLGLSPYSTDFPQIKAWCDDWMALQSASAPESELTRCASSYLDLQQFMLTTLRNHDAASDDLLGALVQARREGQLSEVEQVRLAMGVLVAGHETTTLAIANVAACLVNSPHYQASVHSDAGARTA